MRRIRSVLVLAPELPEATSVLSPEGVAVNWARAFVEVGMAVHLFAPTQGETALSFDDGIVVHRLSAPAPSGALSALRGDIWAANVALQFRNLDPLVHFDVVFAVDVPAALRVELRSSTALVISLDDRIVRASLPDPRHAPNDAASRTLVELAMRRADHLLVASSTSAELLASRFEHRSVAVMPPPVSFLEHLGTIEGFEHRALELLCFGPLDEAHAPEQAIATIAALRDRGHNVHCTVVGQDQVIGRRGGSYRRVVCRKVIRALAVHDGEVTFLEAPDDLATARLLARTDLVLAPNNSGDLEPGPVQALAAGVPVATPSTNALAEFFGPSDGLIAFDLEEIEHFPAAVAAAFDAGQAAVGHRRQPSSRVIEALSAEQATGSFLELLRRDQVLDTVPLSLRQAQKESPSLGLVLYGRGQAANERAIASALHHGDVPLQCVLVGGPEVEVDRALRADPRLRILSLPHNPTRGEALNIGLDALEGAGEYLGFGEGIEFLANWWEPYVDALRADPFVAVAAEEGYRRGPNGALEPLHGTVRGVEEIEVPRGGFFLCSRHTLELLGRFRTVLPGREAIYEFATRAARLGSIVRVGSRQVLLLGCESPLEEYRIGDTGSLRESNPPFIALADASQALEEPELLSTFAGAFTEADEAMLVLYGPGLSQASYVERLEERANAIGFDLEHGPRLAVMLPPTADPLHEQGLASEAVVALGWNSPPPAFAHLATIGLGESDQLRLVAARFWRAQNGRPAEPRAAIG